MLATHTVWRNSEEKFCWSTGDCDSLHRYNDYYMLALNQGYYQAMSVFKKEVMELSCSIYSGLSLKDCNILHYKKIVAKLGERIPKFVLQGDEESMNMKELTKRAYGLYGIPLVEVSSVDTLELKNEQKKPIMDFMKWLEDDPMPPDHKKRMMRRLCKLLDELFMIQIMNENDDLKMSLLDLSCRICWF